MSTSAATWVVRDGRAVWNDKTLAEWAVVLGDDLARGFDAVEVWLFGSVARGEGDGDSDIDVLVILDHYDPALAVDLKQRARSVTAVPAPFDVCFTDPERMESRRGIAGTIERTAMLEGRRVFRRG